MDANRHRIGAMILGMAIFAIPILALACRFGAVRALLILAGVVTVYAIARLAVSFFSRRSGAAKTAAVVLSPELMFLAFLPAHLRKSLARLKEDEAGRTDAKPKRDR